MDHRDELVCAAWALYHELAHEPFVVSPSIPILYFGDAERYFRSNVKAITVGLNPSREEFPVDSRFRRFADGGMFGADKAAELGSDAFLQVLNGYFRGQPYRKWFDISFEKLLNGLESSYYLSYPNAALHTDICTPIATDPTWNGLSPVVRNRLESAGADLWHGLVEYLLPDVILISVAWAHLAKIRFPAINDWQPLYTIEYHSNGSARRRPYVVQAKRVRVAGQKTALLVFGRAANTPFGTVSGTDKLAIGRAIRREIDGG